MREAGHRGRCQIRETFDDFDYEVEAILEERRVHHATGGQLEMRVKWKGWPEEDSTWEPLDSLSGCPAVLSAWRSQHPAAA